MSKLIDAIGHKYGRLTVVAYHHTDPNRQRWFLTRCDCGGEKITALSRMRSGLTLSCGCLAFEYANFGTRTHGMTGSRAWYSWRDARGRCTNPQDAAWKNYGGRGISMCPEWSNSFAQFHADMGPMPDHLTLDRIDVNGNYEPGNCRWATKSEQARNTRTSKLNQIAADEIRRLSDAGVSQTRIARDFNISPSLVSNVVHWRAWK